MLLTNTPVLLVLIVIALCPPNLGLISLCRPLGPPNTRSRSGGVWARGALGVAPTALRCAEADAGRGTDSASSTRLQQDLARTERELEKLNVRVSELEAEKAEKQAALQELNTDDAGHTIDEAESAPLRSSDTAMKSREPSWWHPEQVQVAAYLL